MAPQCISIWGVGLEAKDIIQPSVRFELATPMSPTLYQLQGKKENGELYQYFFNYVTNLSQTRKGVAQVVIYSGYQSQLSIYIISLTGLNFF